MIPRSPGRQTTVASRGVSLPVSTATGRLGLKHFTWGGLASFTGRRLHLCWHIEVELTLHPHWHEANALDFCSAGRCVGYANVSHPGVHVFFLEGRPCTPTHSVVHVFLLEGRSHTPTHVMTKLRSINLSNSFPKGLLLTGRTLLPEVVNEVGYKSKNYNQFIQQTSIKNENSSPSQRHRSQIMYN